MSIGAQQPEAADLSGGCELLALSTGNESQVL